jgi:hypothetical protein
MYNEEELDERYNLPEIPSPANKIKTLAVEDSFKLSEILKLVGDTDPTKVDISVEFEAPDWTSIVITVTEE